MTSFSQPDKAAPAFWLWCLAGLLTVVLAAISFKYADVTVARMLQGEASHHVQHLAGGLAGKILVSCETLVILLIIALRHIYGPLPKIVGVLAIACVTSICAYALNSEVLKFIFGVPNPGDVLNHGAAHAFHWLQGSRNSGFPSGHMMLAGGFGGVFMYCYPKSRYFLGALLIFGMCLLVYGTWHFISDVLIGAYGGVSTGLLAGEIWALHMSGKTTKMKA